MPNDALTHEQTTLALIGLILFKLGVTKEEVQVALETYAAHDTTRKGPSHDAPGA